MANKKQFFPEELPTEKTEKEKRGTPRADADLLTVAERVSESWLNNGHIALLWTNATEFSGHVAAFKSGVNKTRSASALRPAQSQQLAVLDKTTDDAVKEVKLYIKLKWKQAADAQYARFGILRERGSMRLPKDRDERYQSLLLMVRAIAEDGFDNEEYGKDFWTGMVNQYKTALTVSGQTHGAISTSAGNKNEVKKNIQKTLKCLTLVLKGNYPDSYPQVLRAWGWQKEQY